jgi:hypothetical protein
VQVDEGFMKAFLHDVFGILSEASEAQHNRENLPARSLDEDLERFSIPLLCGSNE